MNSKELVSRTLAGQDVPRAVVGPLAVHCCARLAGISLRDYTLNPRLLADSVIRHYDQFRPDAVWLSADTWVTAETMGAAVAFPGPEQPLAGTGAPCVRSMADIERIGPPDPQRQGRWPLMLEALRLIDGAIGKEAFIVACFDQYPFSLACALMGIQQVMLLRDRRPAADRVADGQVQRIHGRLRRGPGGGRGRHAQRRRFAGGPDWPRALSPGGLAL